MPLVQTRGAASAQGFGEFAQASGPVTYIEDVFSTYLYTGNGSTQTITNNIDLAGKGGLVILKNRSNGSFPFFWWDSARGNYVLLSDRTDAQYNYAGDLVSLNSNGFSLGSPTNTFGINGNNYSQVSWTFRKQAKFFDVVTYTGDGNAGKTVAHNLGSVPGCIIVKRTDSAAFWGVYHRGVNGGTNPEQYYLKLDGTDAQIGPNSALWNSTAPTSTQFTLGTASGVNFSGGTYVAYLFAHDAGGFGLTGTDNVISCGTYTTSGSGSATVSLGYEPQWVLTKATSGIYGTTDWVIADNMRGMPAPPTTDKVGGLFPNTSGAEDNNYNRSVHPTSTGFVANQYNSTPYIYIAIRRGPMKVPTVGTSVYDAKLYTGAGTNPVTISGISMVPDLASNFIRDGNGQGAIWWDRLRGGSVNLEPRSTGSENTQTSATATFDKMTTVTVSGGDVNVSSSPFVNHFFRRAPSFFDEVCYTGTEISGQTFTHNLGAVPEMMIVKSRSGTTDWTVYHSALGASARIYLNATNAANTGTAAPWNSTTPTSSVFSLGNAGATNLDTATFVNYLFATCAGVSKVGSYTGNGTTQTINCGFGAGGARFVLLKRTDSTGDWYVYDTARGMTTLTDPYLWFNSLAAEAATLGSVTTVSTGFALNSAITAAINVSAGTYIFLAIA